MEPLWAELINSDWHDYLGRGRDEDRLDDPAWLADFLLRWGMPEIDAEGRGTRRRLRDLRDLLSRLVIKLVHAKPLTASDLRALNGFLDLDAVVRKVRPCELGYEMECKPLKGGLNGVLSEIAASFVFLLTQGDSTRIKVCENPDCRWVIYDRSKNRTRRWCEGPTGCGNLIKVRRHRARRRAAEAGPESTRMNRVRNRTPMT